MIYLIYLFIIFLLYFYIDEYFISCKLTKCMSSYTLNTNNNKCCFNINNVGSYNDNCDPITFNQDNTISNKNCCNTKEGF